jgi:hypothetical protein
MLRTSYYGAYMSVNISVRLDDALAERLRLRPPDFITPAS